MHSISAKIHPFVETCDIFHRMKIESFKSRPFTPGIPVDYFSMKSLSFDIKLDTNYTVYSKTNQLSIEK